MYVIIAMRDVSALKGTLPLLVVVLISITCLGGTNASAVIRGDKCAPMEKEAERLRHSIDAFIDEFQKVCASVKSM